jgi:hypothetical protein
MSENSVIGLGSNFNTDDKYGHQSEWYKKQIREEAKFAFEHNSVSLEETGYDGRPIVNEARAIANGAICVLRDRGYRKMFDNFETENQEEIVDVLTEFAQMHIDSVLAKNNIYEKSAVDAPKAENVVHNTDYGDEHVLRLNNGNEIRVPPYPTPCDYVRVVRAGREVAYWSVDEWKEQPAEVMGAIMGAADTDEMPGYGQTAIDEDRRIDDLNYELRHFHAIAGRWGTKPGLTQLEACHGAIREAYGLRFSGKVPQPTPVGEFNPNRVYDAYYDMTYANQIKERTIRAAKDLFKD